MAIPNVCPVCCGRTSVPQGFYATPLPSDWEPGTCCEPADDEAQWHSSDGEAECRSCDGTGVVWPPGGAQAEFTLDEGMWSYAIPGGTTVSVSGAFGWDSTPSTTDIVSLSLVKDGSEDD